MRTSASRQQAPCRCSHAPRASTTRTTSTPLRDRGLDAHQARAEEGRAQSGRRGRGRGIPGRNRVRGAEQAGRALSRPGQCLAQQRQRLPHLGGRDPCGAGRRECEGRERNEQPGTRSANGGESLQCICAGKAKSASAVQPGNRWSCEPVLRVDWSSPRRQGSTSAKNSLAHIPHPCHTITSLHRLIHEFGVWTTHTAWRAHARNQRLSASCGAAATLAMRTPK